MAHSSWGASCLPKAYSITKGVVFLLCVCWEHFLSSWVGRGSALPSKELGAEQRWLTMSKASGEPENLRCASLDKSQLLSYPDTWTLENLRADTGDVTMCVSRSNTICLIYAQSRWMQLFGTRNYLATFIQFTKEKLGQCSHPKWRSQKCTRLVL